VHVKETLVSLVGIIIREKHPHKLEGDVKYMIEQIRKGYIDEWISEAVIDRMYDTQDQEVLLKLIS